MIIPTMIMGIVALGLLIYGTHNGTHAKGLKIAFDMIVKIIPLLVFAFITIGMIQVIFPKGGLANWVGPESGFKGILLGAIAGGLTPGSSLFMLPLMAGLLRSGAGIGTLVAFMTSWSTWAVIRLPIEVGILGWKFTVVRLISTALLPILAGIIAKCLFSWVKFI